MTTPTTTTNPAAAAALQANDAMLGLIYDWIEEAEEFLSSGDDDDDVIAGMKPRFNCLNLFRVPQRHNVSYVPPFAPVGRYAITGWFREW